MSLCLKTFSACKIVSFPRVIYKTLLRPTQKANAFAVQIYIAWHEPSTAELRCVTLQYVTQVGKWIDIAPLLLSDIRPCSPLKVDRRFGGKCSLRIQTKEHAKQDTRMKGIAGSLLSASPLATSFTLVRLSAYLGSLVWISHRKPLFELFPCFLPPFPFSVLSAQP
jgi:hypothetical protein